MQMSFWGQTPRAQVLGSMDGPELGSIHGEPLRSKSEGVSPPVHPICGTNGRAPRESCHSDHGRPRSHEPGDAIRSASTNCSQGQSKAQSSGKGQSRSNAFDSHSCARCQRRMGIEYHDVPAWVYGESIGQSRSECSSHAGSPAAYGECIAPCDATSRESEPGKSARDGGSILLGMDQDTDGETQVHADTKHLWKLVTMIERELETALKKHRPLGKPFMSADVFCSSQSPLCHQVQKLGELAFRCGLDQGDLSQPATIRSWLFSQIAIHRPCHIWYSPVCGPWSSWSDSNAARSELSQQEFRNKRSNLMYQLALGLVFLSPANPKWATTLSLGATCEVTHVSPARSCRDSWVFSNMSI